MSVFTRLSSAVLILLLSCTTVMAAEPINTLERSGLFGYKPSGVAIRGYDTVAYFTEGKPVEGSDDFVSDYRGATWKFASADHRALFEDDPERYVPQYGGYCAYGVAQDSLVKIEPENWTIIDDKLYLNYNDDLQSKWEKDTSGFISEADNKFDALLAAE